MEKNAIPDTNIFLHYDVSSIDWCKELGSEKVEIIVCSTVLKELDEKKFDGQQTIAYRATKNLSMIESHDASKNEIRKNVTLSVIMKEPKIDWDAVGLDSSLNDDRILGFIKERNDPNDVLVSDDTTPRIKGRGIDISVMKLSCERLPNPKTEERKEIEMLEKELLRLQNKSPDLSLRLITPETTEDDLPKFTIKEIHDLSSVQIESMVSEREQEINIGSSSFQLTLFTSNREIEDYKSDVKKYLDSYRKYIIDKIPVDRELSTILEMKLVLSCKRTPGEDIHCNIEFPEDFQILEEQDLPKRPVEPTKPRIRTMLERMSSRFNLGTLTPFDYDYLDNIIKPVSENNVIFYIDSNKVQIKIKKINHGFEIELCTLYVKLPSIESAKTFEVSCTIHAANMTDPIEKRIPVIIEKVV